MNEFGSDPPAEFLWPLCPACGRRRYAVCPYCKSSGDRFATTELAWEADHDVVRVVCPTCDEPFEPQFRGRCHGCGHAFDPQAPPDPPPEPYEDSSRAVWVLFVTIVAMTALGAYFAWLLR